MKFLQIMSIYYALFILIFVTLAVNESYETLWPLSSILTLGITGALIMAGVVANLRAGQLTTRFIMKGGLDKEGNPIQRAVYKHGLHKTNPLIVVATGGILIYLSSIMISSGQPLFAACLSTLIAGFMIVDWVHDERGKKYY